MGISRINGTRNEARTGTTIGRILLSRSSAEVFCREHPSLLTDDTPTILVVVDEAAKAARLMPVRAAADI
jgi:hypothetical protein